MPSKTDWDLGQALLDRGACTLDQLREAISLKDRLGRPIDELLLEQGYVTVEQLQEGRRRLGMPAGKYAPARPAPPRPGKMAPPEPPGPARDLGLRLVVGAVAILFAAGALMLLIPESEEAARAVAPEVDPADQAKADLEKIIRFQERSEDLANAGEVLRRYDAFMARHAGTEAEIFAHDQRQAYARRCEAVAKAELKKLLEREGGLDTQERLELYQSFPSRFLQITETGRTVRDRIRELGARVRREVRDRARDARLGAALRREIADRYFEVDAAFRRALTDRDPAAAGRRVFEFVDREWTDEERPFVRVDGVNYEELVGSVRAWEPERVAELCSQGVPDVSSADRLLPGETALLDLRTAAYVSLFLKDARREFKGTDAAFDALEPKALVALAERAKSPPERIGFFCLYTGPDFEGRALLFLTRAHRAGVPGIRPYTTNMVARAQEDLGRVLQAKLEAAELYVGRRQWEPARMLLEQILLHETHPFVTERRPRLEKLLHEMTQKAEEHKGLEEKYLGKVTPVDADTLRVVYDFTDEAQLRAFEGIGKTESRLFRGRWSVHKGMLESVTASSVMQWRWPFKGDVSVEFKLGFLEEPQNFVLGLYYNAGAASHYSMTLGFDWVGREDGDADNTAEDRFGMPRTCLLKYPVDVRKEAWKQEAEWRKWKARIVGAATGDWRPKAGVPYQARFERKGSAIRFLVDGAPVWEGDDHEYTRGHLYLYSDCRARLDDLVVTFTPIE